NEIKSRPRVLALQMVVAKTEKQNLIEQRTDLSARGLNQSQPYVPRGEFNSCKILRNFAFRSQYNNCCCVGEVLAVRLILKSYLPHQCVYIGVGSDSKMPI